MVDTSFESLGIILLKKILSTSLDLINHMFQEHLRQHCGFHEDKPSKSTILPQMP